jgi:hypothetical protein
MLVSRTSCYESVLEHEVSTDGLVILARQVKDPRRNVGGGQHQPASVPERRRENTLKIRAEAGIRV